MNKIYQLSIICIVALGLLSGCIEPSYHLSVSCTWQDMAAAQFDNIDLELPMNSEGRFSQLVYYFPCFSISTLMDQIANHASSYGWENTFTLTSTSTEKCTTSTSSGSKSVNQDNYTSAFGNISTDRFEGVQMVNNAAIAMTSYKFQMCLQIKGVLDPQTGNTGTLTWEQKWPTRHGYGCSWSENPLVWNFTFPEEYNYASFHTTNNAPGRIIYVGSQYVEL